jgi:hypothetical protein
MLSMAPDIGLLGIYGSMISAGIFGIIAAPFISRLLPLFPLVVTALSREAAAYWMPPHSRGMTRERDAPPRSRPGDQLPR